MTKEERSKLEDIETLLDSVERDTLVNLNRQVMEARRIVIELMKASHEVTKLLLSNEPTE